jgi:exodeoxyribonuclease V gamma subunit
VAPSARAPRRAQSRPGLATACTRHADEPYLVELPTRLSSFNLTHLPASHVDVLDALAAARDVHLFVLHPPPGLWEHISRDVATDRPSCGAAMSHRRNATEPAARHVGS